MSILNCLRFKLTKICRFFCTIFLVFLDFQHRVLLKLQFQPYIVLSLDISLLENEYNNCKHLMTKKFKEKNNAENKYAIRHDKNVKSWGINSP